MCVILFNNLYTYQIQYNLIKKLRHNIIIISRILKSFERSQLHTLYLCIHPTIEVYRGILPGAMQNIHSLVFKF